MENQNLKPDALTIRTTRLKVWQAVLFIALICSSLITLALWGGWNSRQHQLHEKEVAMSNLAQALSSEVHSTIKQSDTVLLWLVAEIEEDGMSGAKTPHVQALLDTQLSQLKLLRGLFIFDEQGNWLASTVKHMPPNLNYSDREYFIYHREHADSGPYIGHSIRSKSTGEWILTVSRRINHPDGSFAGVAVATVTLEHFLRLWESIDIGQNGVVSLIAADSTILVRRPFKEAEIGMSLAKGPLFTELLPKAPFGTASIRSIVDGVERIASYRRIDDYPLIIFVALDRIEGLASWRKDVQYSALLTTVLLIFLCALGYRMVRLMRRQNFVQSALLLAQDQLIDVNLELQSQALEDGLTKLANRRLFDQFLRDEMGRAKREGSFVGLLMIDIDHFKRFNDEHGHLVGDECLRAVGKLIKETIRRPGDLAARYGGEEFAVVLPGVDSAGAFVVAEKIRRAVETLKVESTAEVQLNVTVSIGVSVMTLSSGGDPEDLILAADKALYAAKEAGRNQTAMAT